ncbi:uncharacterized protein Z518_07193 [Rhinocladiella mackenziei CBS 650.93]|uniref:DUF985 domain-containing protein n=1 Tax=Rhinocladiella mackenziei CBS 650.93 TaxID=1442369 RepID=A0A0D2J3S4_9EURO|nr:uncharacterized protein Z518_07193 [Rhinocladiella mackenziei CBS 650.93]KIX03640.1 hypothetical protein Z518_07193 [Rhinocladiella mackenziei CBS 650.93]
MASSNLLIPDHETTYAQFLLQNPPPSESSSILKTISMLSLQSHIEGGYFVETDRDPLLVPNPFQHLPLLTNATSKDTSSTRHASTTIFYLITPRSPTGYFHRNRGRTVHTLHRGRGRYVLIHADQRDPQGRVPVETFVVGQDIEKGEKLQWIVEGGKFKASFLLPDPKSDVSEQGLLISETVVPGFEYMDHDFMTAEAMVDLLSPEKREELKWLLKKGEQERWEEAISEK